MASAINALSSNASTSSSSSSANLGASAPSEEVFLQLLVAQIQNQDPLNPTDSTQFVSQLAQFSELEQVIAIRGDIETQMSNSTAAQNAAAAANSGSTTTSNTNPADNQTATQGTTTSDPASTNGSNPS